MTQPKASSASASGRVLVFLEDELKRNPGEATVRLPPVREIAAQLKVSTSTIHLVYKELLREGRLRTGVGRGALLVNQALEERAQESRPLCIALTTSLNGNSDEAIAWKRALVESLLKVLSRQERRITLLPINDTGKNAQENFEHLLKEVEHVDGMIFGFQQQLLPFRKRLSEAYESAGKPVVTLHTQELFYHSYNSVLTDFFGDSQMLGHALYRAGRRRIVCLCVKNLDFAISNQQRFFGMQLGVSSAGGGDNALPLYWSAEGSLIADGYACVKQALKGGGPRPDAIFCAGDYLALGAIRALEEAGLSVPEDVSVIGSTGINLEGSIRPAMTRMIQCFDDVAERVVAMLLRRIDRKEPQVPGEYPPVRWYYGDTTTQQENAFIQEDIAARDAIAQTC